MPPRDEIPVSGVETDGDMELRVPPRVVGRSPVCRC